jgi:hypothetical protein
LIRNLAEGVFARHHHCRSTSCGRTLSPSSQTRSAITPTRQINPFTKLYCLVNAVF